jgi:hypothetical protein
VNDDADSTAVAPPRDNHVERTAKTEAVNAMQCCRSRAGSKGGLTDVAEQSRQLVNQGARRRKETEGVRSDLHEETVRDPLPKLSIGHADVRSLSTRERTPLSGGDLSQTSFNWFHVAIKASGCHIDLADQSRS